MNNIDSFFCIAFVYRSEGTWLTLEMTAVCVSFSALPIILIKDNCLDVEYSLNVVYSRRCKSIFLNGPVGACVIELKELKLTHHYWALSHWLTKR